MSRSAPAGWPLIRGIILLMAALAIAAGGSGAAVAGIHRCVEESHGEHFQATKQIVPAATWSSAAAHECGTCPETHCASAGGCSISPAPALASTGHRSPPPPSPQGNLQPASVVLSSASHRPPTPPPQAIT